MPDWVRRFRQSPQAVIGTSILGFIVVLMIVGPVLAPFSPEEFHFGARLKGPGREFLLGTDQFGRDILSRILFGARSTVILAFLATVLGTVIGVAIGLTSGYLGGRADDLIMRLVDAMMAIPSLLFALLIVAALGASGVNALIAIGIAFAPGMARVTRGVTLSVRARDYVSAATARGERPLYIMFREILPNVIGPVIVESTIRVAFAIMLLATMSFLGVGAQPPASEWGLMISEAREFMFRNPWLAIWPGLGLALVAMGFNLFGDGLRDVLNPKAGQ